MNKKNLFSKGSKVLLLATAAAMYVSCSEDFSDEISSLSERVTSVEESITDLQDQINAGGLVSEVIATATGFEIYFTGGTTDMITITNGEDGVDGQDGVDGTNGTNGEDGVDGQDGVDGTNGANGEDGVDGQDGADGTNGTNGTNGVDGQDGADGQDITVANITYRNEGNYALFFFDAVGEVEQRVIYAPMDVETPTSVTLLTGSIDIKVGGTATFDVVVNPSANATSIDEFCLVLEEAYTRAAGESIYGTSPSGLTILDCSAHATIAGRYSIEVECTDAHALDDAVFIAAKYTVNEFSGTISYDGSIDADTYASYKAADGATLYNVASEYELLSSTPLFNSTVSYNALVDADLESVADIHMYVGESSEFDLLANIANIINVQDIITGVTVINSGAASTSDLSITYNDSTNKVTVQSIKLNQTSIKKGLHVIVEVEDFNTAVNAQVEFNVYVYLKADIEAYAASTTLAFLPAVNDYFATAYVAGTETKDLTADFSVGLSTAYTYNFEDYTSEITFEDTYNLASIVPEVIAAYDASSLMTAIFNTVDDVVYQLASDNDDNSILLQPGTYTITVLGTATPVDNPDAEPLTVKLINEIKVQSPEYKIAAVTANFVSGTSDYMATQWIDFDVNDGTLTAPTATTVQVINDAPYSYQFDSTGDNVVTTDGVRTMIDGSATKTVEFVKTTGSAFDAEVIFYYELTTGVKFPIVVDVDAVSYDHLMVKYAEIELDLTTLEYISPIDYFNADGTQNSTVYAATPDFEATQLLSDVDASEANETISTNSTYQPNVFDGTNNVAYSSLVSYAYATVPTVEISYDGGANWSAISSGDPIAASGIIAVAENGDVTIAANNINWTALPTGTLYRQVVEITATDFFGASVTGDFTVLVQE